MESAVLISVEEYLKTSYRPDREYIEGRVQERRIGEYDHASVQSDILGLFLRMADEKGLDAVVEQRIQVRPDRFRVPDVCVRLQPVKEEMIFTLPPFLVVEVLSKDDVMTEVEERVEDYVVFGVSYVWVIDPRRRRGYVYTEGRRTEAIDGVLRTSNPIIEIRLEDALRRVR